MLQQAILGPLFNVAGKVIDRMFPDKIEAEEMKNKFAIELQKIEQKEINGFRDFVVEYEGKGDQVHPAIQILRGSVRPILTYFLVFIYAWGFLHPNQFSPEVMTGLFQLNLISLGFWYGERALKNLGLNISGAK